MALQQDSRASWEKANFASHYSYRDFHTAVIALAPDTYVVGTNARAVAVGNWPAVGDWTNALPAYGREVTFLCTTDVIVLLTCLNPRYLELLNSYAYIEGSVEKAIIRLEAEDIPQTLTETPMTLRAGNAYTFHPTYLTAITYYHPSQIGTLDICIEGSVEGKE